MNTKEIASTILQQLGGNKFIVMTGAKNFLCGVDENENPYLSFKFAMFSKANYCRITLTPQDLYDMEFIKLTKANLTTFTKKEGLYCDMIERVFSEVTGLDTRIGEVYRVIN